MALLCELQNLRKMACGDDIRFITRNDFRLFMATWIAFSVLDRENRGFL